jgi:hypothetical protein
MSFTYQERSADSPFIKSIWHTQSGMPGVFTAAPDGCWDIIITKYHGMIRITLNGQALTAATVPYDEGAETLGISFKPEVFLSPLPGEYLVGRAIELPTASSTTFWLDNQTFEIPTFENVEGFIDKLIRDNLLTRSEVVSRFVRGHPKTTSERTLQRHFLRTTGLTPYYFSQLQRVQQAVMLLQQGKRAIDVAFETGYADQPHMAKAIKHIMGRTPAEIARQNS